MTAQNITALVAALTALVTAVGTLISHLQLRKVVNSSGSGADVGTAASGTGAGAQGAS